MQRVFRYKTLFVHRKASEKSATLNPTRRCRVPRRVAGGAHAARGGGGGRVAARAVRRALGAHAVAAAHGGLPRQRRQVRADHRQRRARRRHRAAEVQPA